MRSFDIKDEKMALSRSLQSLALPPYPSRSRLYYLEPIEHGMPLVESLTSYIVRLAEAHCIPTGVLMEAEVAAIIDKTHGGANLHKIYSHISALNGTGIMALNLAKALEELTKQKNLHLLTLTVLFELLPQRKLLRRHRAWCPICYQEWRVAESVIYEPLLWSIDVVKVCPFHRCILFENCPHCRHENLHLSWHSRSGHCSKCQKWLGSLLINSSNDKKLTEDELEAQIWVAESVGGLLAAMSNVAPFATKENLAKSFKAYVNSVSNGNVAEFARQLQLPRNTVWLWCKGRNLPQLDTLVRVCHYLNRSLLEFITQEAEQDVHVTLTKYSLPLPQPKTKARAIDTAHLEQQLEAILLNHECPPPPMEEVARRLELHRETIFRHFPEFCRAISARYDEFQKSRQRQAIELSCEEVKQAVLKLHSKGLYPSEGRVAQFMSKPGYLRYKQVRAAIAEAKLEFSTQGQTPSSN